MVKDSNEERYFNFPIQLLKGLPYEKKETMNSILYYSVYDHALNQLEEGTIKQRFKSSVKYYQVKLQDVNDALASGEYLHDLLGPRTPKVGLRTEIFWDFYKNYKTEFEVTCLLAYLSLKSIVQNKPYCKITNLYMFSRMDGEARTLDSAEDITEGLKWYHTEYQIKKIKAELAENWNVVFYGRYTRGFYVSFKMTLEDLVYEVEKKRKARKFKEQKAKQDLALMKALERLNVH